MRISLEKELSIALEEELLPTKEDPQSKLQDVVDEQKGG